MKKLFYLLSISFLAVSMLNCSNPAEKKNAETQTAEITQTAKVTVYYFHGKQRCKTCLAIQKVTEQAIQDQYPGNDDVKFVELDYSDSANEAIAEKYEVASSSLLVTSPSDFTNLTDDAFANALRDPEKLKEKLVAEINNYLEK